MRRSRSIVSWLGLMSLLPFLSNPAPAHAQTPTRLSPDSLYNAYNMNFASFVRGGSVQAHWMQDGSSFWYTEGAPDSTIIYKVDPEANTRVVLIDPERLRRALAPLLDHEPPSRGLPFETFEFQDDEKAVRFTLEEKEFLLRLDSYEISWSPSIPGEPNLPSSRELPSPDGRWRLSFKDYNLVIRSTVDGSAFPLTSDGIEEFSWVPFDPASWVHWSPNGGRLAVRRDDHRGVPKIAIPCFAEDEDVRWVEYPTAGQPWPRTELRVLEIPSGESVTIDIAGDDPDQYRSGHILGWQVDGSGLFLLRMNRFRTKFEVLAADPATGAAHVLFAETQRAPSGLRPDRNTLFTMLADGRRVVWLSDRSGSPQLYLYHIDGRLIATLTPDTLLAISAIAEDDVRGWLYWTALANGPRADTHLYRIRLDGTGLARLTEETGRHDIQVAPSRSFFIDTHSSAVRPPSVDLRRADGTLVRTLATADITELEEFGWKPPEEFVVTAADRVTEVYGVLYKPHDFDPGRRYPVIDQVFLAATGALDAPRDFFTATWAPALAQLGFIVVRVDWRGSLGGGSVRESIYGNIGRYEIPDHVAALEQLAAERSYMDLSRVGIFGGSYGGYIALRAMLQAPDFFDVGIASAPITDMAEHYGNEIAVGPIETNLEAYEYASNIPIAKNLRGMLLLVHGTCDAAVPLSHTIRIIQEFTRTGRPYNLILVPGEDHGGWSPSNAAYFLDARRRYFVEHLKP